MSKLSIEGLIEGLNESLEKAGGNMVSPPNVLSASVLLELTGESVRGRLCSFQGPDGEEYCLRPDMTAPIALEIAKGAYKAASYRYSGPVFRFPRADTQDSVEFDQCGFEWFGGASKPSVDAEGMALALEAVAAQGLSNGELYFGDVSLFAAFIDGLNLDPAWTERLKKAFNRKFGPRELIEKGGKARVRSPLAQALSTLSEDEATAAVEEVLAVSGITLVGGRTTDDIAGRLRSMSVNATTDEVPEHAAKAILSFLDVDTSALKAESELSKVAKSAGVDLSQALEGFGARQTELEALKPPMLKGARFAAEYGRRFDYYTGLVFEVSHSELSKGGPIASGGRCDALVGMLSSGKIEANAFGVAIRPDRLLAAIEKEQA